MGLRKIIEDLGESREEFIRKGMQCRSIEEMLTLAKEYGIDLSEGQAAELLDLMKGLSCKLSDEELGAVAGGYERYEDLWEQFIEKLTIEYDPNYAPKFDIGDIPAPIQDAIFPTDKSKK